MKDRGSRETIGEKNSSLCSGICFSNPNENMYPRIWDEIELIIISSSFQTTNSHNYNLQNKIENHSQVWLKEVNQQGGNLIETTNYKCVCCDSMGF